MGFEPNFSQRHSFHFTVANLRKHQRRAARKHSFLEESKKAVEESGDKKLAAEFRRLREGAANASWRALKGFAQFVKDRVRTPRKVTP